MSSTYVHYGSSPGSIPSDFGLISRYNQHKGHPHEENENANESNATIDEEGGFQAHDALRRPRSSFSYGTTSHTPTIAGGINTRLGSRSRERLNETEPLLGQIPVIEEDGDYSNNDKEPALDRSVWLSEVSKHCIYCARLLTGLNGSSGFSVNILLQSLGEIITSLPSTLRLITPQNTCT